MTFSVTNSAKAILVFRMPESVLQEKPSKDEAAPQAEAAQDEADVQEETAEAVGEAE